MGLPAIGDLVADKFRIDEVLGEGGFARVYGATRIDTKRRVAIKVLKPGTGGNDPTRVARFVRELRAIANLTNAHTLRVFDCGTLGELPYMVCEFVDGEDLTDALARRGRFSEAETIRVLVQVLASLAEAHEAGILHRDIKPSNIRMFEYMGDRLRIKVLDFGLAKSIDGDDAALTAAGRVVGTPRFMSAEQLRGEKLAPSSDIYSVGLVAWELLDGPGSVALRDLRGDRTLPAEVGVSDGFRVIIDRMLAREVRDRYQRANDVIADLRMVMRSAPDRAPTIVDRRNVEVVDDTVEDGAAGDTVEDGIASHTTKVKEKAVATESTVGSPLRWLGVIAAVVVGTVATMLLLARSETARPSGNAIQQIYTSRAIAKPDSDAPARRAPVPAVGCPDDPGFRGVQDWSHGGVTYRAAVPKAYTPARRHPVVIGFGSLTTADLNRFAELAEKRGVPVLASPEQPGDERSVGEAIDAARSVFCVDWQRMLVVSPRDRMQGCGPFLGVADAGKPTSAQACPRRVRFESVEQAWGHFDALLAWTPPPPLAPGSTVCGRKYRCAQRCEATEYGSDCEGALVSPDPSGWAVAGLPGRGTFWIRAHARTPEGMLVSVGPADKRGIVSSARVLVLGDAVSESGSSEPIARIPAMGPSVVDVAVDGDGLVVQTTTPDGQTCADERSFPRRERSGVWGVTVGEPYGTNAWQHVEKVEVCVVEF